MNKVEENIEREVRNIIKTEINNAIKDGNSKRADNFSLYLKKHNSKYENRYKINNIYNLIKYAFVYLVNKRISYADMIFATILILSFSFIFDIYNNKNDTILIKSSDFVELFEKMNNETKTDSTLTADIETGAVKNINNVEHDLLIANFRNYSTQEKLRRVKELENDLHEKNKILEKYKKITESIKKIE